MQLSIPKAPRSVTLLQVPGAVRRLSIVVALAAAIALGLALLGIKAGTWLSAERGFFEKAEEVPAKVISVQVPKTTVDESPVAQLTVLYTFSGRTISASAVSTSASLARSLLPGSTVTLLVDPSRPEAPREASYARDSTGLSRFMPFGVGLGLLIGIVLIASELRRQIRAELAPLKNGMLVWLTPDDELPKTKAETTFAASYWRDDRKYQVRARARPARAPVKNGGKLLAAVVPTQPTWVRVIDEDLARSLGWFA